jgi:dTMP kinase
MSQPAGLFIALEGGDGAGKSTQSRLLADALIQAGHEVILTREPGGTPAAEAIRAIVLSPEFDGLDARAEALLFAAARSEHVHRLIRPALERGAIVITDRFVDSSIAYQGVARNLGVDVIAEINLWATQNLLPDLTVLLDVEATTGLGRATDPNRLENEPAAFHHAVVEAFRQRASLDPDHYLVLPASNPVDAIAAQILDRVLVQISERTAR